MPESYVVIGKVGFVPFSNTMMDDLLNLCETNHTVFFVEHVGIFVTGKTPMQVGPSAYVMFCNVLKYFYS